MPSSDSLFASGENKKQKTEFPQDFAKELTNSAGALSQKMAKVQPFPEVQPVVVVEKTDAQRMPADVWDSLAFETSPATNNLGSPVDLHSQLFRTVPVSSVRSDGSVTINFDTIHSVPAAAVYFGITLPHSHYPLARHRKRVVSTWQGSGPYEVSFSVLKLLKEKYDVAQMARNGIGQVEWRLEVQDVQEGTTRLFDSAVAFRCEPTPCTKTSTFYPVPAVVHGPFVDRVDTTSAVIGWDTDMPSSGVVGLIAGTDGKRIQVVSSKIATRHEVVVTNLEPGTHYTYRVVSGGEDGEAYTYRRLAFSTEALQQNKFRFAVMSDSRSGHGAGESRYGGSNSAVLTDLLVGAANRDPSLIVFVGDLIDGYTTQRGVYQYELNMWRKITRIVGGLVPIYEVMGNHESLIDAWSPGWTLGKTGKHSAEAIFGELFVNPTNGPAVDKKTEPPFSENVYSFDYGNVHFAAINSNYWFRSHAEHPNHPHAGKGFREGMVPKIVLDWLDKDLQDARQRGQDHLFVFTHEPMFPNGGHVQDGMWWHGKFADVNVMRNRLVSILSKHKVGAIFHGDEHNYSRTKIDASVSPSADTALWQIISGGAGAPFYAQANTPWKTNVHAFRTEQHFVEVTINGKSAAITAIDRHGKIIDSVTLPKR